MRASELDPKLQPALVTLGMIAQRSAQHEAALEHFRTAASLDPRDPHVFLHWGRSLAATCQVDKAIRGFEQALRLRPAFAQAELALGECYLSDQRYEEAEACLRRAVVTEPSLAAAHLQLGRALCHLDRHDEAQACFESCLAIDPRNTSALVESATLARNVGSSTVSVKLLRQAVAVEPSRADLLVALGAALLDDGDLTAALESYDSALAMAPELPQAHARRALALLQSGQLKTGWQEYEWRWQCAAAPRRSCFSQPQWDGAPLAGKTILIHGEQGVGDEIMFASCYAEVIAQAAHVAILCEPRLEKILQRSFPRARVFPVPRGREHLWTAPPDLQIDTQIAAGSLPRYLRNELSDFPRVDRYLIADPTKTAQWQERFSALGPGMKIGVSWRAGEALHDRAKRTAALKLWQPLLEAPGAHFINLQYGDCRAELDALTSSSGLVVHHWQDADNLRNLEGLAARVAALDLVISVGNTTVHLAGALGVPTWNLLPHSGGWRWFDAAARTPWYSGARLYRQRRSGDWGDLFARVRQDLLTTQARADEDRQQRAAHGPHWNQVGKNVDIR